MHEPTGEFDENEGKLTDVDLQHITSITGEGSYLHQLALDQSPDFIDELQKFLSTHRFTQAVQDLDDTQPDTEGRDKPPRELPAITYVNPEFIFEGIKHIADLKHLIKIYTERTGNQAIIMQTDFTRDSRSGY